MHDTLICHDLLQYISEYVDGTLREELCSQLEAHIHSCDNCQIVVNTMKKTIDLYKETSHEEQALPKDVRSRLFARLDLEDFIDRS
jgi:anti-sigma factor RsiW